MVDLVRDPLGFLRVAPIPTEAELKAHYDSYYLGGKVNSYEASYDALELEYKTICPHEALHIWATRAPGARAGSTGTMLDAGCGEGFSMAGFAEAGWAVTGVDFTSQGLETFNPQLAPHLICGDLYVELRRLSDGGRTFDMVLCDNVLEHVRDPAGALDQLRRLVAPGGLLRVKVPNDGSWLQEEVVRMGGAKDNFFVAYPDHLSYFTLEPLVRLAETVGLSLVTGLGDFPVDLFLLNPNSNYQLDRSRGKASHRVRVLVETLVARQGIDRLVAFREGCAKAGLGRDIICYFAAR